MNITLKEISIGELTNGYVNSNEEGVVGYYGKLNIRPSYQREFVYGDKQRDAVIDTVTRKLPLGVIYWAKNIDDTYELLDGQQRILSICKYINGDYSIKNAYFYTLPTDKQKEILDYKLLVYVCDGNDSERLEWFRTINISGEKLTNQELLNANYTGPWLTDAKRKFSKTNCVAYMLGNKYLNGTPIRQDYLETVLKWVSNNHIEAFMAEHRNDPNANKLWLYFQSVINWVKTIFGEENYRKEMKGLDWGRLYNLYHENDYDATAIEKRVNELMSYEDVTNKKGVYEYILSGEDENLACKLSVRTFSERDKRTAYERQNGICPITGEKLPIEEMEADHIVPWWKGGTTTLDNLQMISKTANKRKSGRADY